MCLARDLQTTGNKSGPVCPLLQLFQSILVATSVVVLGSLPSFAADTPVENPAIDRINTFWQSGNRAAAHAAIDSLLPLARLEADSVFVCRLLVMRGLMHTAMGDGVRGESPLREGLELARTLSNVKQELRALRWLGVALGQNLKEVEARQIFGQMRDLAVANSEGEAEAWAETGLAFQNQRRGESTLARIGYERAISLFQDAEQVRGEIFALNGLGIVLEWQNDFAAARRCYEQTLVVSRKINDRFVEALAENNLGTMEYGLGDPGVALAHFRRSHEINIANDNVREAVNAAHNIAVCLTNLGNYNQSLELLDQAQQICRERQYQDLEYSVLTQKGRILTTQDRASRAAEIFEQLLVEFNSPSPVQTIETYVAYAEALAKLGRTEQSAALLLEHEAEVLAFDNLAVRLIYATRLGISLNRIGQPRAALQQLLIAESQADAVQYNASRLLALPEAGDAFLALGEPDSAMSCYRKAAEIWQYERSVPMDPQWRERRGIAGQYIYTELADLVINQKSDGRSRETRARQAYELLQGFKARTLLERMVGPAGGELAYPEPTTLAQLQRALRTDGEVFLDYFVGRQRSFLFAVTAQDIQVVELPGAAELTERILLFRDLVAAAAGNQSSMSAERRRTLAVGSGALRNILLGSAAEVIATDARIIFCPDGALNKLPMAMILGSDGDPNPVSDLGIDGHVVQRVPSATIFTRLRGDSRPDAVPLDRLLAVAGEDQLGTQTLAAAAREVEWIGNRFNGVVKAMPDSTARAANFAGFDLIHLASHTRMNDDAPWRSEVWVRTAGGEGRVISAVEIASGEQSANLAVLANCESAGGRVVTGEGVMGLSSAFIAAGSPTVIASLWRVDDAATFLFMREFYTMLSDGATVIQAIEKSRAKLKQTKRFADPYFWAGFVSIGDGERTFELKSRLRLENWQLFLAIGLIMLTAAAVMFHRQSANKFS